MEALWQDIRHCLIVLIKKPGFTVIAMITLALGIGANTAMFSLLNTYLIRPLPYPHPEELVRVYRTSPHSDSWPHSAPNFLDHKSRNTVFSHMSAFTWQGPNLAEPGEPAERLSAIASTYDLFEVLGTKPALGRVFTSDDDQPGAARVVVISDRFWLRRFGGAEKIIGRKIQLDGEPVTIVGVMPPEFDHPLLWGKIDAWLPIAFTPEQRQNRDSNYLRSFARLKPGVTIEQAQQAMATLQASMAKEFSLTSNESIRLEPFGKAVTDQTGRQVLWFTFGLAGFVLLIACANLANLQLVRTANRTREYSLRAALGAGRGRLLRQSLIESVVVAVLGGIISLLLAYGSIEFVNRRLFSELPGARITLDLKVFGFALLVSLLTGLAFGIIPAWLASRTDINQALKSSLRGSTASRSHHRLRHTLIIGEVAFALVLLTGAGLFLRAISRFAQTNPGWRVDGVITAQVGLRGISYTTPAQRSAFYARLEDRIRTIPGVQSVSLSNSQLVWGFNSSGGVIVEGQPEPKPEDLPEMYFEPVSPGYFETHGIPILEGRAFTSSDTTDKPRVVIVNQTAARRFWPNQSAVGKRLGRPGKEHNWSEVVGVVNDLKFPGDLDEPYTRLQSFVPLLQQPWGSANIALRTGTGNADAVAGGLRAIVSELDTGLPVYRIASARTLVNRSLGNISLFGTLLGAFAVLGLILAAVGIYGVVSYSVLQRTGEIGIRMALGAQRRDVLWLILGKGARLILIGAVIGAAGAYAVARLLASSIPTLPSKDPIAAVVLTATLIIVALLACYLPALRATRVEPLEALHYE